MKITLTSVFLIILSSLSVFSRSTAVSNKLDSIPAQQRFHLKPAFNPSPDKQQWATDFFYPAKSRSGNEINLPIGFNQTTVQLNSGDRVLQVDKDYVFVPNANRIRVVDEDALISQQPIRITYQRVASIVDRRFILRYRP